MVEVKIKDVDVKLITEVFYMKSIYRATSSTCGLVIRIKGEQFMSLLIWYVTACQYMVAYSCK